MEAPPKTPLTPSGLLIPEGKITASGLRIAGVEEELPSPRPKRVRRRVSAALLHLVKTAPRR